MSKKSKPVTKKNTGTKKVSKDSAYLMKADRNRKVMRIILWVLLAFIFLRGVIACLHPDKTSELNRIIADFKTEFYSTQDTDYEVMGFAENFCQEYLTYDIDGKDSFMTRISPYISKKVNTEEIYSFKNSCEATSVHAYKIDSTSKTQVDVYVKAQVTYNYEVQEDSTTKITKRVKTIMLKVPIHISKNGYVVEDIPMYVNDSMYDSDYKPNGMYNGDSVESDSYEATVISFLIAYYAADQNAVNYLLSSDADATKFSCLGNTYSFTKIENLQAYETKSGILCLVSFKITDVSSGAVIAQDLNLTLTSSGKRMYVKDLNTKIINLEE